MKKVGKTTRPFRYDLNHVPKDYTVDMRPRFEGLDLIGIECQMNYGLGVVILYSDQDHAQEKEMQKGKMVI